jgi:hypothetical protein
MMLVSSTYHIWFLLDLLIVSSGATCVGMFHVWFLTFQYSFILWIIFVILDPSSLLAYVNLYVFGVVLHIYTVPQGSGAVLLHRCCREAG